MSFEIMSNCDHKLAEFMINGATVAEQTILLTEDRKDNEIITACVYRRSACSDLSQISMRIYSTAPWYAEGEQDFSLFRF